MSLTARPVSVDDLLQLQDGLQFFTDPAQAATEAAAINVFFNPTETVYRYATSLLADNISTSMVAVAVTSLMEGGKIPSDVPFLMPIGDAHTPGTLTFLATQFLPAQIAVAEAHGLNPTVYAAEALGLAMAGDQLFNSRYGLDPNGFAATVGIATGISPAAITGWNNNWKAFYSGVGADAHPGLTVDQAAAGAAYGDAVGAGLLTSTSKDPRDFPAQNNLYLKVANALINTSEGITSQPSDGVIVHKLLEGEASMPSLVLGIDATPTGFHGPVGV